MGYKECRPRFVPNDTSNVTLNISTTVQVNCTNVTKVVSVVLNGTNSSNSTTVFSNVTEVVCTDVTTYNATLHYLEHTGSTSDVIPGRLNETNHTVTWEGDPFETCYRFADPLLDEIED